MEISLRDIKRVRIHDFVYTLKHWRTAFTIVEKFAIAILLVLVLATSWRWALAANSAATHDPANGGTYIEGVITNNLDTVDLGRLTKAALVRVDEKGNILPDLATKWEVSADKSDYKFTLIPKVSSYVITDILQKNPTYLPTGASAQVVDPTTVEFKLTSPDSQFLNELSTPLFPYGPYKVDKKTDTEIRLKINSDYHLKRPYFDRFVVRKYENADDLQAAANRGNITGSFDLGSVPNGWQNAKVTLNKKHFLFINSSKPYLKATNVRNQILSGEKPNGIDTLSVLEVNGLTVDEEYAALKDKLIKAGVKLDVRRVSLKDALSADLPKRNYDILYILINEGSSYDPYLFWHSDNRIGTGQNFAELANADIDRLCEEYRSTEDAAKRQEILDKIKSLVNDEKVSVEYKNIEETYSASGNVKGFFLPKNMALETDRYNFILSWYLNQKLF